MRPDRIGDTANEVADQGCFGRPRHRWPFNNPPMITPYTSRDDTSKMYHRNVQVRHDSSAVERDHRLGHFGKDKGNYQRKHEERPVGTDRNHDFLDDILECIRTDWKRSAVLNRRRQSYPFVLKSAVPPAESCSGLLLTSLPIACTRRRPP